MNKRIKLIFLASFILNVILIGIIAGHSYKRLHKHPKHKIASFIDKTSLSNEEKDLLKGEFEANFTHKKDHKLMMKSIHEELYKIMIAESFEVKKYRDTIYKISNHHHQKQNNSFEMVIKIADNLNLKERRDLAKILRRPPSRHHRR